MNEDQEVEVFLQELAEKYGSQLGSFPETPDKDTLLQFMRDLIDQEDPLQQSKAANLKDEEVGSPVAPSLVYANMANYADTEGLDYVASYLRDKVGTLAGLSLSRRAKLLETLFTVRRETRHLPVPKTTKKKSLFGGVTETKEGFET